MTTPTDETPGQHGTRRNLFEKHPVITQGIVALAAGFIGASAGLLGAKLQADASEGVAQRQLQEAAQKQAREQRDVTYREYLDAANGYHVAATTLFARTAPQDVNAALTSFMTARSKFQTETNEVYVYGTDEAWRAHQRLASTLPPSLGDSSQKFSASDVSDEATFAAAYNGFLAVRCREVAAQSRPGCVSG
ncbi:hypothetical protein PUN71_015435 [Arthrobacter sp. NQ7]|uniref:hypothetical protein n=1 Tax=Arthrobacter sp. NQ7 TaxID=3032303 RepID=UPI0024105113|nr:hypothetical protein [Arthrobacter sp. NQ7]MDJ0458596.1 hypothetical protein [Arthrobacter sp. NQ7]